MKQHIAIFSFVVLFLIPFSFAYAEEKYQNDSFGYSINVPEEYTVSQSFHNVVILTTEEKNNSNGIDSISVLVTINDGKSFSEMIQLVKNDIENFGNIITDETQIDLGNDNIDEIGNNQNKVTLIKSYTDIGTTIFFENVVAYHNNLAYFITLTYTDKSIQDDFHNILESFEFAQEDFIPKWIKTISERWANGDKETVSDKDFAYAIKFMLTMSSLQDLKNLEDDVHNHAIPTNNDEGKTVLLPSWLKHPTTSWVNGEIDNTTWKNLIVYLYENEIILI